MISVAIVEDNAGFRQSLESLLNESPGFRCVVVCVSAEEALRLIPSAPPEVILMDIHLPTLSGIECTARLKQLVPHVRVIMITAYADADKIFKALRAGACGYLLKRSPPNKILEAIKDVQAGGAPMSSEIARKVVAAFQQPQPLQGENSELSGREQEVLDFLSQGFADKEIAQLLSVTVPTIRYHLHRIYQKLHVRSRTEALAQIAVSRKALSTA